MAVSAVLAEGRRMVCEIADLLQVPNQLAKETIGELVLKSDLTPDGLNSVDQNRLNAWYSALGDSLVIRCDLRHEADGPSGKGWTATNASHERIGLNPVLEEADGREIAVTVEITKAPLETRFVEEMKAAGVASAEKVRIVVFFSAAALQRILADYQIFEKDLLKVSESGPAYRLVLILIADVQGRLSGPHVALLGTDHLDEAATLVTERGPEDRDWAYAKMSEECLWDTRPRFLTPDFLVLRDVVDLTSCQEELCRLRNELSVSYLANRTTGKPGALQAGFDGNRSVAGGVERGSEAPYDLYRWAYRDQESTHTRLEIVRLVAASRLPLGTLSYAEFAARAPDVQSECEVQLRLLLDSNLADSFERRERVEKLVRDSVNESSQQNASLSKEVVDNAYKTVGLLVGVAIAYLLKPDQGIKILILGVALYVVYILFILVFYLRSLDEERQAKLAAFEAGQAGLQQFQILDTETQARFESVRAENQKLLKKFATVRRIYWFLVIAGVLLVGWFAFAGHDETPAAARLYALDKQAALFKRFGYGDIRTDADGWTIPSPLVDAQGRAVRPDLTAIRKEDNRLLVLTWVPCTSIGKTDELTKLQGLQRLSRESQAELQVLTQAVCGRDSGTDRLRRWLHPLDLKIWSS